MGPKTFWNFIYISRPLQFHEIILNFSLNKKKSWNWIGMNIQMRLHKGLGSITNWLNAECSEQFSFKPIFYGN